MISIKFNTTENQTWEDSTRSKIETPQLSFENAWTHNGEAISTAGGSQYDPQIISDGAGGAIITWSTSYSTVYTQRVNSNGSTQWTTNGKVISTAGGSQVEPQIISDGAGGAIITWHENRNGSSDIYAQRVNSNGNFQWTSKGVTISNASGNQIDPKIISDGTGGAIITWVDLRNGSGRDIYAQWVNSSGITQWTANGTTICNASGDQLDPQITSDGAGGAIITFYDYRIADNSDIYTQRVNSSGFTQWTPNGVAICTVSRGQYDPKITSDGAGGAIITWHDERYGTNTYNIYAQHVNSNGNTQWTPNGAAISTADGAQVVPQIISDGGGGAIITWHDYRSGDPDIYVQRVNSNGITQWTTDGVAICTTNGIHYSPELINDGTGGAIIAWEDYRSGNGDIYVQRVNSSGFIQWTANGTAISTASNDQRYPQITSDGVGGAIITWRDWRSGTNWDIYAQRIKNGIPTLNHPEPINTFIDGSETLNWILYDDCGGGGYRVMANNTAGTFYTWVDWTPWLNNTPLNIPINRTELGVYNYTIEYYDDQYQYGIPDTVIVSIYILEANITTIFLNGQNKTLQKYFELDYKENLNITIEYREISTMNFIDGATIELTGGISYLLFEKHPIYEQYSVIINSVDLNVGINYLNISANKTGCSSASINISIFVKSTTEQGNQIPIVPSYNTVILLGISLIFIVVIIRRKFKNQEKILNP